MIQWKGWEDRDDDPSSPSISMLVLRSEILMRRADNRSNPSKPSSPH
jgi:hypothetical protein